MKITFPLLALMLLSFEGYSQNLKYTYQGRYNPAVKQERLADLSYLTEISHDVWPKLALPMNEREELNNRRKFDFPQGYYIFPQGDIYANIVDYVSVGISATCHGKALTAQSLTDKLTPEQKHILANADMGTDINLRIRYKYKKQVTNAHCGKVVEGFLSITVVPETEAEYPGGFEAFSQYLNKNVFNVVGNKNLPDKISQTMIQFSINEHGQPLDAKLTQASFDSSFNKLLLNALKRMPNWTPALNSKGLKVKQEFIIPLGGGGC